MVENEIQGQDIEVRMPKSDDTLVAVDPGELDAIILNYITNAIYWLAQVKSGRKLEFHLRKLKGGSRVRVASPFANSL